jgi:hypothetical protein
MTELIWDGKYDAHGRKVAPPRIALPFQTVETVNESAADGDRMQDLFASGRETDWRNRLIWGDKKYVLPSLLEEFAGKVNLIYIDPPFATGGDFSFTANVPNDPEQEDPNDVIRREVDLETSPVNAIVSVLMLREGWDVQNVTVIVGLRPYSAKANILLEQTLGRGLRLLFRGEGTGYVERVM